MVRSSGVSAWKVYRAVTTFDVLLASLEEVFVMDEEADESG